MGDRKMNGNNIENLLKKLVGLEFIETQVDNVRTCNKFKLMSEPVSYQLTIHINNLKSYVDPSSKHEFIFTMSEILNMIYTVLRVGNCSGVLNNRIKQIILHYGEEAVKNHLNVFHGQNIA